MGFTAVFCLPPPSLLLPGAVAPHPSSFSCVCVVLWRGGVSCEVSACFSFGFSWRVRAGLVDGIGLRGCLLRWRMVMNEGSFVCRVLVSVCVPVGGLVGAPGFDVICRAWLVVWSGENARGRCAYPLLTLPL